MNDMSDMNIGEDQELISETIKYATIIVSTVPILCLYPFLQKYFTKGMMIGAIKDNKRPATILCMVGGFIAIDNN